MRVLPLLRVTKLLFPEPRLLLTCSITEKLHMSSGHSVGCRVWRYSGSEVSCTDDTVTLLAEKDTCMN